MKLYEITNNQELLTGQLNPNDEHYTPSYAILPLLKYLEPNCKIWCPFDTIESNYYKVLTEAGHTVICTHISTGGDFFTTQPPSGIDYIISNPPYSLKTEVFARLFDLNIPFAMLVGVVGVFESKTRFNLFKENNFEIMYFNKRVSFFKDFGTQKQQLNPPFSSVYISSGILPTKIIFETILK